MPTYEYDLNSIPAAYYASSTTGGPMYAAYNPTVTISSKFDDVDDKIKEYEEKLDQHVEQLEEDIQFFNEERIKQEEAIKALINAGVEKDKKIKDLEDKCGYFDGYTSYLEGRLRALEDKFNEN